MSGDPVDRQARRWARWLVVAGALREVWPALALVAALVLLWAALT